MPAPSMRNKGESLAQKVKGTPHTNHLADRRDRLHATAARRAGTWEATASTLEDRAARARVDLDRAVQLQRYAKSVRTGEASPPPPGAVAVVARPMALPSYWLGYCQRCEAGMWTFTATPRVPICEECSRALAQKKAAKRNPSGWW